MKDALKFWNDKCSKFLVGKTIAAVRYMNDEEAEMFDGEKCLVIFFKDGSYIFPSRDDEGNGAGALFTSDDDLPIIPVAG